MDRIDKVDGMLSNAEAIEEAWGTEEVQKRELAVQRELTAHMDKGISKTLAAWGAEQRAKEAAWAERQPKETSEEATTPYTKENIEAHRTEEAAKKRARLAQEAVTYGEKAKEAGVWGLGAEAEEAQEEMCKRITDRIAASPSYRANELARLRAKLDPQPKGEGTSDGSTASYYVLPPQAIELQHLISHKDMNAQLGEIFRATYRYGECSHSSKERELKKIIFYANAELERVRKLPLN